MLTAPARFNFVTDTFEKWSSDRLCMRWIDDTGADRAISWNEMSENANRVVNVLRAHGVKKGDRVFIQVGRLPEWWETMLACLKMGAIAMITTRFTRAKRRRSRSRATARFVRGPSAMTTSSPANRSAISRISPGPSGSSGEPEGDGSG